jgi:AraC-like DNA-binding protein
MLAIADKTTEDDSNENDEYGLSQHDYEFTQHLQQQVDGHLSENDFSLETLANELNMSRSSFYRKVKALTGMSPVDYMRTARLNRAAQLIRQHQRITDVMFSTGFTSSSYFAKCFKNQFGLTPKEYSEAGS